MPPLGPAFLHRPLPGLSALSGRRAWDWFVEGLAIGAPARIREMGWRPVFRLASASSDSEERRSIERSWLGATRLAVARGADASLRAVELPSREVFETRVDLPAAAEASLPEAVSHRIDALSPLPVYEVVFALGRAERKGDRLDVPIAIARKATIDRLKESPDGAGIGVIGAQIDETGRFRFTFYEDGERGVTARKALFRLAAVILGVLLLLFGVGLHLDRRLAAIEAHERALVATLRAEKDQARFLAQPPAPLTRITAAMIEKRLAALDAALPEGVWIEEISLSGDGAVAAGFARAKTLWTKGAAPALSASDRPGVERFSLSVPAAGGGENQ
ncbi:MAG: hypothetical protein ACOZAA_06165 [Pseudomonadota bacterium]